MQERSPRKRASSLINNSTPTHIVSFGLSNSALGFDSGNSITYSRRGVPAKDKAREMRALSFYFPAGTGLGCGFLPLDSFFLSLLPMMFSCLVFRFTRHHPS